MKKHVFMVEIDADPELGMEDQSVVEELLDTVLKEGGFEGTARISRTVQLTDGDDILPVVMSAPKEG